MRALAAAGAEEGIWLRAERQTAGRGRQGRNWTAPEGNLSCSTLVRLRPGDPPAPSLAFVAAIAVYDALSGYLGGRLSLKWPNDLMVGSAKLGGILLERVEDAVIIGIGINLAAAPPMTERPVTALAVEMGECVPPDVVLSALADQFGQWLAIWREAGLAEIGRQWCDRAHGEGTLLATHGPEGHLLKGRFAGLASDGALRLRLDDGAVHVMHAGDIFLV